MVQTQASSARTLSSVIFIPNLLMMGYWQNSHSGRNSAHLCCWRYIGRIIHYSLRRAMVRVNDDLPP